MKKINASARNEKGKWECDVYRNQRGVEGQKNYEVCEKCVKRGNL
jgi:hypothetical protein